MNAVPQHSSRPHSGCQTGKTLVARTTVIRVKMINRLQSMAMSMPAMVARWNPLLMVMMYSRQFLV